MIDPGTEVEWQSVIGFKVYLVTELLTMSLYCYSSRVEVVVCY